jgi:hypothetical protein
MDEIETLDTGKASNSKPVIPERHLSEFIKGYVTSLQASEILTEYAHNEKFLAPEKEIPVTTINNQVTSGIIDAFKLVDGNIYLLKLDGEKSVNAYKSVLKEKATKSTSRELTQAETEKLRTAKVEFEKRINTAIAKGEAPDITEVYYQVAKEYGVQMDKLVKTRVKTS